MNGQKPSMGRVVIYNHPNKKKDDEHHPIKSPAIVMRAWQSTKEQQEKRTVNLCVFSNIGRNVILFLKGIEYGEGFDQWNWPPRI